MHKQTLARLWRWRYLLRSLVGGLVTVSLAACILPSPPPTGQPVSPPPEILNSPLMDNRWRVEEVIYQEGSVTFDLYRPVYVYFNRWGTIGIRSEGCGTSSASLIMYLGEQRYRIGDGTSLPVDCGGGFLAEVDCTELGGSDDDPLACIQAINKQFGDVERALTATHEYELRDDALILRGEGAEMRLILDNP